MLRLEDIPSGWKNALTPLFASGVLDPLSQNLTTESSTYTLFPAQGDWFRALRETPLSQTRVVILGQDPYHGPAQAHGLAFSVSRATKIPPSLRNIYKEIATEYGQPPPAHGDLTRWANQGVLLMNTALTVRAGEAGSHRKLGWAPLIKEVIHAINKRRHGVVFLLWGKSAQSWAPMVDITRHHILTAPHPSPLSAYRGFFGCQHFTKVNALLRAQHERPIDWIDTDTELA
jgi:uracil-DNA glycosylase